jgi:hypothetical protein
VSVGAGGLGNLPGVERTLQPDPGFDLQAERRSFALVSRINKNEMIRFAQRYTTEGRVHSIDFAPDLPDGVTLEDGSTAWQIEVYADEGTTDSDPDSTLVDDPLISGTKVMILVRDGVDGVTYKHIVSVAGSNGETYTQPATGKVIDP